MKVVIFSVKFINYMASLTESLSKIADLEILLIVPKNEDPLMNKIWSSNLKLKILDMPRLSSPSIFFFMINVLKEITNFKPDLIHIQHNGHPFFFLIFPFLYKYPIVDTIHNAKPHLGEEKFRTKFMMHVSLFFSSNFITHGNNVKRQMLRYYGIDSNRVDFTFMGGDIQRGVGIMSQFESTLDSESDNLILFFGRIWQYKGLDYLVLAEPLISKQIENFSIIIAGTGEPIEKYEARMVNRENFKIINKSIELDEINELFQKASLVVLPYISASQSGVIPLAYSYCKPVVSTHVGSLSEYVLNGNTGILVKPRDEKALARAINLLLENQSFRKKLGQQGRNFYQEKLSWENIAQRTVEIYKKSILSKIKK